MQSKPFHQKSWRYCRGSPDATISERTLLSSLKTFLRNNMFEGLLQPLHLLVILNCSACLRTQKPRTGQRNREGIRGFKSAMKATMLRAHRDQRSRFEPSE